MASSTGGGGRRARVAPADDGDADGAPSASAELRSSRDKLMGGASGSAARAGGGGGGGDGGAGNRQLQQQRSLDEELAEQEQDLTEIETAIGQVANRADIIKEQLDQQTVLLDDIGVGVGRTESAMQSISRRTADLVSKSGGPRPFCIIAFLVAVILVLLMLIIYS